MAEDTAVPVENAPKAEAISDQDINIDKECKLEVRVNETESLMLEDETMPTYLSITSNTSSLKPDDSKVQTDPHDADTDDEDIKSVYDVSSGDEGQENSRAFYARRRNNHDIHHDEDGDDDDDDDDDEDEDYEDSDDSHINEKAGRMMFRGESDEDDDNFVDEEEDGDIDEGEEGSDGEIEPELFERSSDDYILRNSNSSLEKLYKERSKSLQDLSSSGKLSRSNSKRHVFIHSEHAGLQPLPLNYDDAGRNSLVQSKYNHVPNKVRRHSQDLKGQNKRWAQIRSSEKGNLNPYMIINDEIDADQQTDNLRLNPQCRRLKSYAEYAMKYIVGEEISSDQPININNQITSLVNGVEIIPSDTIKHFEQSRGRQEIMEIDDTNIQHDYDKKEINKPNGTINCPKINVELEFQQKENGSVEQLNPTINREEIVESIVDVQTLTYEEYMKSNIDCDDKPNKISNNNEMKCVNDSEVVINPNKLSSIPSPIQIENMVTDEVSLQSESNNKIDEPEIESVRSQMHQNSAENIQSKEDYEKLVNENLELRKKIEELKVALTIQQAEMKCKAVKVAAVQTENPPRTMRHTSTTTYLQLPNKLSTSMMPDTGSTISSIEQWTDSDYSPVVSLKPPNVDHVLNSDNSILQGSRKNSSEAPSRALLTTNRILQTLANMTPDRPAPNIMEKFNVQRQSKNPMNPLITDGENSRKRKASDNLETSALGHLPSKIPYTNTTDSLRKLNSNSNTDSAANSAAESSRSDATAIDVDTSQSAGVDIHQDLQENEVADDDGVKCYVWHEDENTHERSCLIQAPVGLDNSNKSSDVKKPLRECGPYLLGNLEVRISEANGTLNIWGKEVSQKLKSKDSMSTDEPLNKTIRDPDNDWPKTPQTTLNNNFKCSTGKKVKTPVSVRANITRHLRGLINRTPSPTNEQAENHSNDINLCQHETNHSHKCHNHKHILAPTCGNKHIKTQTKSFCCACKRKNVVRDCNCPREHKSTVDSAHFHCGIAHHCAFPSSNLNCHCRNLRQNHVCTNHLSEEDYNYDACHRLSDSEPEDCCARDNKRQFYSADVNNCNHRVENVCCQGMIPHKMGVDTCSTHYPSEGIDPEMHFNKSPKVLDKHDHRLGKRVRHLVGFLKSCGDCQNPETSSEDSQIPEMETINTRSNPNIRVDSGSSKASFSKHSNNLGNKKGCNSCAKHAGRAAELEAELEFSRVEISKLHSRSNAMREMLHRMLESDLITET